MDDALIKCPVCGVEMNYEYKHTNYTQWMCFNCGYGSTSHMVSGSDFVSSSKESMAELIKDLEFIDSENLVWYPSVINIAEKGILFPSGHNKDDWGWAVAPLVKIGKDEKSRFPKGQNYKVDFPKMETFPKESFALAVTHLNSL